MFLQVEQLRELIKSYTVAASVAKASGVASDREYANSILADINKLRILLGTNAELMEIFYEQLNIPAAAAITTTQNIWFSKNDRAYVIKRGIAALVNTTQISLVNQGARKKTITREPVAWQQLFPTIQSVALGQQTLFDLPEALRFGENQALNIGITGQNAAGFLFLHGATLKDNLEDATVKDLQDEIIDKKTGETLYLPETQLVPIEFTFPSAVINTFATDPNGSNDILTVKSDRSVLLLRVSTTATNSRIDKLTDEARNQTLCDRVEQAGVASTFNNQFTTWYDLPYPHLLRRGSRLKAVIQNGSPLAANATMPANVLNYLTFEGITL